VTSFTVFTGHGRCQWHLNPATAWLSRAPIPPQAALQHKPDHRWRGDPPSGHRHGGPGAKEPGAGASTESDRALTCNSAASSADSVFVLLNRGQPQPLGVCVRQAAAERIKRTTP